MCVCVWKLKHESVHAFQNLPGINIQLHAAGSVEGQQSTFSRKLAGEQSGLRVSPGKQINCVHTRRTLSVCHHLQAGIFPPERSSQTYIPLRAPFDLNSFPSPGENRPSNFVNVTLPNKCLLVFSYLFIYFPHSHGIPLSCCSGADDLLPILSFVALQCQCPQLVSECAALEEFIHEGWVIPTGKNNLSFLFLFSPFPVQWRFVPSVALGATVTCSVHVRHDAAVEACLKQSSMMHSYSRILLKNQFILNS